MGVRTQHRHHFTNRTHCDYFGVGQPTACEPHAALSLIHAANPRLVSHTRLFPSFMRLILKYLFLMFTSFEFNRILLSDRKGWALLFPCL